MMRRFLLPLSAACLLLGLLPGRALAASPPGEVWIAIRADKAAGRGTAQDPCDGSTAARMKALLAALPESTRVHFAEGTFPIEPASRFCGAGELLCGVELKDGWKFEGAGQGRTILRADYAGLSRQAKEKATSYCLLQGGLARPGGLAGFELRNVTLDCNPGKAGANLPKAKIVATALGLNGTHCLIEGVEMIHGYNGNQTAGTEAFYVAIGRPPGADGFGNTVRRCHLHAMSEARSLELLLGLSGFGETTFANRDLLFEENLLDGLDENGHLATQGLNWFTAGGKSTQPNFKMTGNTVRNCGVAAYGDTAATPLDNCQIVGNTFEIPPDGVGIYVLHPLTHTFIDGNVFRFAGPGGQGIILGQGDQPVSGLMLSNNLFTGEKRCAVNLCGDPHLTEALIVNNRVEGKSGLGALCNVSGLGADVTISGNILPTPER
ncbi:hypothetical protein SAMN05444156_1369 [Verrucomicrobium sp. GAS474]|uniref:hypothetical protein n=1 Tax=Verrucomicrobium sp. GAS474 TaxID=1882831 RepID=UPI00087AC2EA|nr:hypothetical protein [Verrucomicrobium sp. GAS474]SDU00190.1 hypothetical protein SAMN05444156_1369 [Verrucomicrobium sp. GAS474]